MAITQSPVWNIGIVFRDRDNNGSVLSYNQPATVAFSAVTTLLTGTIIPAVQALSDAVVTGWTVSLGATDLLFGTGTDVAPETSDVERKGVFQFRAENFGKMKIEVPSISNLFVVDGTNALNPAAPEVVAFIDAIITSGAEADGVTTYIGSTLVAPIGTPHKIHRQSNKG